MKIEILGSGGGEGYPALFCGCKHCEAARKAGGKSLRSLSQTLIDGKLLIDLPPDTHMHFMENNINFGEIENVLITHVHDDHYCPNLFSSRGTDFAPVLGVEKVHLYGNADVEKLFEGYYKLFPIREEKYRLSHADAVQKREDRRVRRHAVKGEPRARTGRAELHNRRRQVRAFVPSGQRISYGRNARIY